MHKEATLKIMAKEVADKYKNNNSPWGRMKGETELMKVVNQAITHITKENQWSGGTPASFAIQKSRAEDKFRIEKVLHIINGDTKKFEEEWGPCPSINKLRTQEEFDMEYIYEILSEQENQSASSDEVRVSEYTMEQIVNGRLSKDSNLQKAIMKVKEHKLSTNQANKMYKDWTAFNKVQRSEYNEDISNKDKWEAAKTRAEAQEKLVLKILNQQFSESVLEIVKEELDNGDYGAAWKNLADHYIGSIDATTQMESNIADSIDAMLLNEDVDLELYIKIARIFYDVLEKCNCARSDQQKLIDLKHAIKNGGSEFYISVFDECRKDKALKLSYKGTLEYIRSEVHNQMMEQSISTSYGTDDRKVKSFRATRVYDPRRGRRCKHCDGEHWDWDCPSQSKEEGNEKIKCFKCGEFGHKANKCSEDMIKSYKSSIARLKKSGMDIAEAAKAFQKEWDREN